ncbi:MAG: ABC transporter substrate-binding protein [Clostridia bacterium]|nr:ABC transporter substrate-binding protein [Clostridia bacterium]
MKKRIIAVIMMTLMVFSLFACSSEPKLDTEKEISVMVLNGTTGFGMAKLMEDDKADVAALNYKFSVETDASNINAALINGSADIAALPTNAASVLYNKTNGAVQVAALNTLGVLYVVEKGDSVKSFADLKGKTVYVPSKGSNPEYIMNFLCEKNGLEVGKDITLDFTYNAPADLRTAVAAGKVDLAVLPEPMVTIAKTANAELNTALDLTKEWDKVATPGSLVQGCIVVRKEFAESNPTELAKFLEEYEVSIKYTTEDAKGAGELIAKHGIFEKAPVATKAIPNCNVCFVKGEEMKTALSAFYQVLFDANPAAIGGKLPADDHYYIAQ